jgi:hypothetical protein
MVFAHAKWVTTDPCAFLTILPVTPGNAPVVSVIHCVRQYIRPATDGAAATNDPLNNRTFVFMGDCFPPQLPTIKMEPPTGIIDCGQPLAMPVSNDGPMDAFYQPHEDEELVPRRTAATQQDIRCSLDISLHRRPAAQGCLGKGEDPPDADGGRRSSGLPTFGGLDEGRMWRKEWRP